MGVVLRQRERILRLIRSGYNDHVENILNNPYVQSLIQDKIIPISRILSETEFEELAKQISFDRSSNGFTKCVEHKKVCFASYPHEWPPEMLHCAAKFTIDLAVKLLEHSLILKDASAQNILFQGPHPIFVDILSLNFREPLNPIWLPYAQFLRSFLLPLLAKKEIQLPIHQSLLNRSEGLYPEDLYKTFSIFKLMKPNVLSLVTLPILFSSFLGKGKESVIYEEKKARNPEMALFVLKRLFRSLHKHLEKLSPKSGTSTWTHYFSKDESYNKEEFQIKNSIFSKFLKASDAKKLLDIGSNTGFFSIAAAKQGASVVAIDSDPSVVGLLWSQAKQMNYDILPLVVDICAPSPALGWMNEEHHSFLQRAEGAFDTVLMLAILHHMAVTARIPFKNIAQLCSKITTRNLIIEYIAPEDPLFRTLVRGRGSLYSHLTMQHFEDAFQKHFKILSREKVGTSLRWLYHLEKSQ